MADPLSRVPATLVAALRPLAAEAERSPPTDPDGLTLLDRWSVLFDRRGLPVLVGASGPVGTLLLVDAAHAVAVTPRGWVRLGSHTEALDRFERAAELQDLQQVCEALRAALAGRSP